MANISVRDCEQLRVCRCSLQSKTTQISSVYVHSAHHVTLFMSQLIGALREGWVEFLRIYTTTTLQCVCLDSDHKSEVTTTVYICNEFRKFEIFCRKE